MTETPNTAGESPELRREVINVLSQVLLQTNKIAGKTRRELQDVLGIKIAENPQNEALHQVHAGIADKRIGLYRFFNQPGIGSASSVGNSELKDLVVDPYSKEAKILYHLYDKLIDTTASPEYMDLFKPVNEADVKIASPLLALQRKYKELSEDDENFDLKARIDESVQEATDAKADAAAERAKGKKGDPSAYVQQEKDAKSETARLKKKQRSLQGELRKFNLLGKKLPGVSVDLVSNPKVKSEKFEVDTIPSSCSSTSLNFAGTNQELDKWLDDDQLMRTAKSVEDRYRASGTEKPSASTVLDAFIRKYYGSRLTGAPEEEQERFYGDMRDRLLSEHFPGEEEGEKKEKEDSRVWKGTKATGGFLGRKALGIWKYLTEKV